MKEKLLSIIIKQTQSTEIDLELFRKLDICCKHYNNTNQNLLGNKLLSKIVVGLCNSINLEDTFMIKPDILLYFRNISKFINTNIIDKNRLSINEKVTTLLENHPYIKNNEWPPLHDYSNFSSLTEINPFFFTNENYLVLSKNWENNILSEEYSILFMTLILSKGEYSILIDLLVFEVKKGNAQLYNFHLKHIYNNLESIINNMTFESLFGLLYLIEMKGIEK